MSRRSTLRYRMMNTKGPEHLDLAAKLGMNWVVALSSGQKGGQEENDPPVYMKDYAKIQPIRQQLAKRIEAQKRRSREIISHARSAGMKVIYSTYEPSLPEGFLQAYPRLFSREIREYRTHKLPEIQSSRNLCVARPAVREALAAKIAELCRTLPGIDGLVYTNNESASTTKVWHRCDSCRDVPYSQMMMYLHEAMREGVRRSQRHVKLFYRCWGTHELADHYWRSYQRRLEFGGAEVAGKEWIAHHVECFAPEHLHFVPSRDIPAFLSLLKGDDAAVIYKATWADVNLHHPLNPWIGRYRGHDQICEISMEHSRDAPHVFYIVGREMQRRARRAVQRGVDGLCGVPVFWGVHNVRQSAFHPSQWSLAELNLHLYAALAENVDADLLDVTARYLRRRYGRPLPNELARMLLDSEDVAAEAFNINGIQATGDGLAGFYYQILRYGPMRSDWLKRVYPVPDNIARVFAAKDRNVRRAERMLARIEELAAKMPIEASEEFQLCFANLLNLARRWQASHKHSMLLWALKDKTIEPTTGLLERLHNYGRQSIALAETVSP